MDALLGLDREGLEAAVAAWGQPRFRAGQLARWIYQRFETDPSAMTDLPGALRDQLGAQAVTGAVLDGVRRSQDGTEKLLVRTRDGERVEAVMIPDGDRRTACLSSQVGCPVACAFCASGLGGVKRSLELDEVLAQFLFIQRRLAERGERLSNVVFMGMGEPLLNDRVLRAAIARLNAAEDGFGLGARRITVSTVGIADKISQLAAGKPQYGLALSLHAPNEALRRQLVPYPQRATLDEILAAARGYFQRTGRRVTIEYVLLAGVNDQPEHARQLARLLGSPKGWHLNAIPWNPVSAIGSLARPAPAAIEGWVRPLVKAGFTVTVRRQRGDDVAAACGQLAGEAR